MNAQHEDKESINSAANTGNDSNKTKATILLTNTLETDNPNESMTLQDDSFPEKQDKEREHSDKDDNHSNDDSITNSYCVICLNACEDRTVLETCHHEFCFHCILQWSMISHSCPLCVQIFESCIHNIQDDHSYTVHQFEPLTSTSKKSITGSTTSSSSASAIPYGIIRQLYGPPQQRRRFRGRRNAYTNEGAAEQSVTEQQQQALDKRRHIYRHRLFVKHIGANRISGFQQITPETFKIFPHKLDRLVPWIRRELQAILSLTLQPTSDSSSLTSDPSGQRQDTDRGLELIREYIVAVLKRHDLQTDQAQDLLRDFLYEHTEQFVHELMGFARSPYSIDAYDKVAQYDSSPSISTSLTSATIPIESHSSEELHARTSDSKRHRNRGHGEYNVQDGSSEGPGRYGRRGRLRTRSESNDRRSRSRSPHGGGYGPESFRSAKRRRDSRKERREASQDRYSCGDSDSIHRESRSEDRRSTRSIEKKSYGIGISNEAMAEFPIHSAQAPSEAGRSKDNMGLVAGIDSLNTAKPRDSPSTNRDAIIATLQVKLKREQDLYNANIHNRPTA